jgi:hypothetical protein
MNHEFKYQRHPQQGIRIELGTKAVAVAAMVILAIYCPAMLPVVIPWLIAQR